MAWGTAQWFYNYNRKCQAWVSGSIVSQTATTATISITGYARSGDGSGYYYASDFGVTVKTFSKIGSGGWTQHASRTTVLNYNDNVGSSTTQFTVDKQQTQYTLTLATDADSTTGDWPRASAYITLTIPAKTSYPVSYNANKPSGAAGNVAGLPASQTKWHGMALTLTTQVPSLDLYVFNGWATSASGTVAYQPGASYTGNAALTLYAVWTLAYSPPAVTNHAAQRCTQAGTPDDSGTYAVVQFAWSVDTTADGGANVGDKASIAFKMVEAQNYGTPIQVNLSGTSGTVSRIIGGSMATDSAYDIRMGVTDTHGGTTYRYVTVTTSFFYLDFGPDHGVAIGKPSGKADTFQVGIDAEFDGDVDVSGTLSYRKTVYQSASGTSGNVALSRDISAYGHMLVFYRTTDGFRSSVEVDDPDGRSVPLFSLACPSGGNNLYIKVKTISIGPTALTVTGGSNVNIWPSSISYPVSNTTDILIEKVEVW